MTFSIVARCVRTGELGVAVSTAVPAVGAICPFLRADVGAVSTQSWVNPYLAMRALQHLEQGDSATVALERVIGADPARDLRQLGVVDRTGQAAVWTGAACTGWAGHRQGPGYCVQGNMLAGAATLDAMARAFEDSPDLTLPERLMRALEAGQAAGGDKRGRQSASLKVMGREEYAAWDLRVDEHADPVSELRRVYGVAQHQLAPFVQGMPTREDPGRAPPAHVTDLLLKPPHERPGAAVAAQADLMPNFQADSEALARWMGARFAPERVEQNLRVYQGIVAEISRLRELDLADVHPAVVFDPQRVAASGQGGQS